VRTRQGEPRRRAFLQRIQPRVRNLDCGGVAQADLLGVFGREGVFAARVADAFPTTANFLVAAFDLFRNYDGNGAVVGDSGAYWPTASNYKTTSVYAFAHSDVTAGIEVVAINKNTSAQSVTISACGAPVLTSATLYQLAGNTAAVARVGGTQRQCPAQAEPARSSTQCRR